MPEIVLRIRPDAVMGDLDLDRIRVWAGRLPGWTTEVRDTRLTDAPYITVIATTPAITNEVANTLRSRSSDLPRMGVFIWCGVGREVPLDKADVKVLEDAAASRG